MRNRFMLLAVAMALVFWALPVLAESPVSVGVVVWSHDTDMDVDTAADFDGSDETAEEKAKDWDARGSGVGVRVTYDFPELISLFGEIGQGQVTVRDDDFTDPGMDVQSRGLDDGFYFAFGAQIEGDLGGRDAAFWSAGVKFSSYSADLDENVDTSWDYDETVLSIEGLAGRRIRAVELYGGLRFVQSSADLDENDLGQLPGPTFRRIELEREDEIDVVVGAQTKSEQMKGFVELGFIGTLSATAGFSFRF